jgi:broad specificity phosphatase PhoE
MPDIQIPSRPFYFVRHGRTDANAQALMCGGEWDIALNTEGESQAKALADLVTTLSPKIDKIFCSSMLRARQTADFLNQKLGAKIEIVDGLKEWLVGEWEKRPWGELPNPFNTTVEPPGGETRARFESRIANAVTDALNSFSGTPLFVSHGAAAHALFTVLGTDLLQIKNCEIYLVAPEGGRWVLRIVS